MTHRGPFQPLPFCDSVISAGSHVSSSKPTQGMRLKAQSKGKLGTPELGKAASSSVGTGSPCCAAGAREGAVHWCQRCQS